MRHYWREIILQIYRYIKIFSHPALLRAYMLDIQRSPWKSSGSTYVFWDIFRLTLLVIIILSNRPTFPSFKWKPSSFKPPNIWKDTHHSPISLCSCFSFLCDFFTVLSPFLSIFLPPYPCLSISFSHTHICRHIQISRYYNTLSLYNSYVDA